MPVGALPGDRTLIVAVMATFSPKTPGLDVVPRAMAVLARRTSCVPAFVPAFLEEDCMRHIASRPVWALAAVLLAVAGGASSSAQVGGDKVAWKIAGEFAKPFKATRTKDQARARLTEALHLFEDALHIPQIIYKVRKDDDIEGLMQRRKVVRVRVHEFKLWMAGLRPADHLLREIHANPAPRLKRRQQATIGAA